MIDAFYILGTSGLILFSYNLVSLKGDPLGTFLDEYIKNRCTQTSVGPYTVMASIVSELNLIFITVYQTSLQLSYIPELLQQSILNFGAKCCEVINEINKGIALDLPLSLEKDFTNLLHKVEDSSTRIQSPKATNDSGTKSSKSGKKMRKWDDKVTKEEAEALDYSDKSKAAGNDRFDDKIKTRVTLNKDGIYELTEMETDTAEKKSTGLFKSIINSFSAQKTLNEANLNPIKNKMKDHLISKNVASNIAEVICQSVVDSIKGKQVGTFSSISKIVQQSTEEVVRQILTPSNAQDLLGEIKTSKQQNKVYSICFIGVNGVGKSTNLSKTCFWLLQNNLKVLIAACDTFRSGAVEQLRVHVKNLSKLNNNSSVELFEKGYGKDAAAIAKNAIQYGQKNGFDVVLIDTAGRMQDNEPLMRSLAKLVSDNQPNKIVFVGEALVGNEAVDQLTKFNQALKDYSFSDHPRQIDGILLTKFDTIDDKVGAALSMTFTSKSPILFVGTGQTYTDLKKVNIKSIVDTLFS
ncbi:P-loop containing nucleoside triphosphate hydrolase protein [Rozella allomycis CSF55]|uniref:P-loop containing nucleoside triphosphate hydrolase protein n=1 Tax=Rozella allomycis (strain CSF55) TaxID=988480 RepID=A0A4V1IZF1_ROZAC|nr:P-loop containing nucleoside triphosphate hydrolase protein [Rozella allomycis CSF55]